MKQKVMNKLGPFGHVFHSADLPYYYDVPSQEIVALDPALVAVLIDGEVDRKVWQTIEKARKDEGLFLGTRPRLVSGTLFSETAAEYAKDLKHLILTITENCNLRCRYCLHGASLAWVRPHGPRVMELETALRATEYFLERACEEQKPTISFYGGEALLQKGLIGEVCKVIRRHPRGKEAHLVLDTNGVLLDDVAIDLVVENQMHLQISLDGPRVYHDFQRSDVHGEGSFERIMSALDRLIKKEPEAYRRMSFICTIAPPVDLSQLNEFFREFPLFKQNGIFEEPALRVNLANLNGQNWSATKEEFQDLNHQLLQVREIYFQRIAAGKRQDLGPVYRALVEPGLLRLHLRPRTKLGNEFIPGANCQPGIRKLHVTADGRFQPCERCGDGLVFGDHKKGIEEAAVTDLQESFFQTVHSQCSDCWALRLCGLCYAGWAEHCGQPDTRQSLPQSLCDSIRRRLEEDLQLLVKILELPSEHRSYLDDVILV